MGPSTADNDFKHQICRLVAGLIASDDEFEDSERGFVEKVLSRFGIPKTEWNVIFPLIDTEAAAETIRAMTEDTQEVAFELLLGAAAADGKVTEAERAFLLAVADEIEVDEGEVDRRLAALVM
jgi:hypothetical protein